MVANFQDGRHRLSYTILPIKTAGDQKDDLAIKWYIWASETLVDETN